MMPRAKFEALVEKALSSLPSRFRSRLKNLSIIIETWPEERNKGRMILGLYHGVPFPHRGTFYGNVTPDVIVIYQGTIEALCSSEKEVEEKVREVLFHEIGHYFGLSESQLAQLEKETEEKAKRIKMSENKIKKLR